MTEKQGFAALPPRQKTIVVIILMMAVFAVWEVIGVLRGGKNASIAISPSQPAVAATAPTPKPPQLKPDLPKSAPPAVQQMAGPAPAAATPPRPPASPHLTPQQSHPEVESTPPSSIVLVQQEQVQSKYVNALNELQMLKIQKEIAETSQAIVAAKLATATAEKSISDLLSEGETPANKPGGPTTGPSSTNVEPPQQLPPGVIAETPGSYSVQSVSMEQDQWHAVVKFKDKLYNVSVGDMLPPDKSLVKTIDQRGVTLDMGGMEQRIPLTVTDNVAPPSGTGSAATPSSPPPGP